MIKPDDLNPKQRKAFDTWRRLGLSEQAAMRALRDGGLIPVTDRDRAVEFFRSMGLSEAAAQVAADGRDGYRRGCSRAAGASVTTFQAENAKLFETIERLGWSLRERGEVLGVAEGETREWASLRAAAYKVFGAGAGAAADHGCGGAALAWAVDGVGSISDGYGFEQWRRQDQRGSQPTALSGQEGERGIERRRQCHRRGKL